MRGAVGSDRQPPRRTRACPLRQSLSNLTGGSAQKRLRLVKVQGWTWHFREPLFFQAIFRIINIYSWISLADVPGIYLPISGYWRQAWLGDIFLVVSISFELISAKGPSVCGTCISVKTKTFDIKFTLQSVLGIVLVLLLLWYAAGFPRSYSEYLFHSGLNVFSASTASEIFLKSLMPAEWETVCESHGYDGDLYLEKYQKTYPAAGAMNDGAWGVIFIKPDWGYQSVSSSCANGAYIRFKSETCLNRDTAVLRRASGNAGGRCVQFEAFRRDSTPHGS